MSTSAPLVRMVDQFTGARPSRFWEANREADERIREFDRLARDNEMLSRQNEAALLARLDELEGGSLEQQNRVLARDLAGARRQVEVWRERALAAGWAE